MNQNFLNDLAYYSDRRVIAGESKWYDSFDEKKMTVTYTHYDDEGCEDQRTVPVEFEVCPTCEGKGHHVNPSIDAHGISADEFYEDPDFAEDYFSGLYDEPCRQCGGRRVVPVPMDDDEETLSYLEKKARWDAEYHAERMAERRMGA